MTRDDLETYEKFYRRAEWLIDKGYSNMSHEQLIKLLMQLEQKKLQDAGK